MKFNQKLFMFSIALIIGSLLCMEQPSESKRARISPTSREEAGPSVSPQDAELLLSLLPAQEPSTSESQPEESQQVIRPIPSLYELAQQKILQQKGTYKSNFPTLPQEVQESLKSTAQGTFLKNSPRMNLIFGATSLDEILELINLGLNINDQSGEEQTPFNYFISSNRLPLAHALIDANNIPNLDVWSPDKFGTTPLMNAIIFQDSLLIQKILDKLIKAQKKSTIIVPNALKQTILSLAAQYFNNSQLLEKLLKYSNPRARNRYINRADNYGMTPLMYAAQYNDNPNSIAILIKYGADPNIANSQGNTPLILAAKYNKNPDTIIALIQNGADPNKADLQGFTPLMIAAQFNDKLDNIIALIKHGADPNKANSEGNTALMITAQHNNKRDNIIALIKHGADPNKANSHGNIPLMFAAQHNDNPDNIIALVQYGADINKANLQGFTALMLAAQDNQNIEVIQSLIKDGADLTITNNFGRTALDYAIRNPNPAVLEFLKQYSRPIVMEKG